MNISRFLFALALAAFGLAARLLPHLPNCTPINALALFAGLYFGKCKSQAFLVPAILFLSDLVLGFHSTTPYVYASFAIISLLGYIFNNQFSSKTAILPLIPASSLIFFALTNFGVWLTTSLYAKTAAGLCYCYLAAIPFLANQFIGDLVYSILLASFISLLQKTHICFVEKNCFREKCT